MVRGAAKNHDRVAVVVDPADYAALLASSTRNDGATSIDMRARLAAKAFAHTASYDALVADLPGAARARGRDPFPHRRWASR